MTERGGRGREGRGRGRWQAIDQTHRDEQHAGQAIFTPLLHPQVFPGGHFGLEK